jgi:sugar phosphate isomerase/epimerase
VDPNRVRRLLDDAGLAASSVCPSFTAGRDLSHPDPDVRNNAMDYVRGVAELARAVGAPVIIVAPTAYLRTQPVADPEDEWRWAVESVRSVGEYAASLGVDISLECWNRYGTYLLNRLEEGVRMWRETGLENGGVMADTYHMNIEERSLPEIAEPRACPQPAVQRWPLASFLIQSCGLWGSLLRHLDHPARGR